MLKYIVEYNKSKYNNIKSNINIKSFNKYSNFNMNKFKRFKYVFGP